MKGTEFADALAALDKVTTIRHQRSETVTAAIGATLSWMGARRIQAAVSGQENAAGDGRLLGFLADLEDATVRLDGVPSRGRTLPQRREIWAEIQGLVRRVRRHLDIETALQRAAAS